MWTRVELKERAKAAMRRNYWKLVLVSALLFLLGCGTGGHSAFRMTQNTGHHTEATDAGGAAYTEEAAGTGQESEDVKAAAQHYEISFMEIVVAGIMAIALFIFIFLITFVVISVVAVFLLNPLSVGGCRFMIKSVEDVAQVKEIAYGFDHSYRNVVKVLFFRDLYVFLWTLLFVIPGIVKMFQYYMVPYILTEHPDMEYRTALQLSRDMMEGNKWKTFVLGLSFILWDFFGVLTFGIGELLYVQPYRQLTFAALYCELKKGQQQCDAEVGDGL